MVAPQLRYPNTGTTTTRKMRVLIILLPLLSVTSITKVNAQLLIDLDAVKDVESFRGFQNRAISHSADAYDPVAQMDVSNIEDKVAVSGIEVADSDQIVSYQNDSRTNPDYSQDVDDNLKVESKQSPVFVASPNGGSMDFANLLPDPDVLFNSPLFLQLQKQLINSGRRPPDLIDPQDNEIPDYDNTDYYWDVQGDATDATSFNFRSNEFPSGDALLAKEKTLPLHGSPYDISRPGIVERLSAFHDHPALTFNLNAKAQASDQSSLELAAMGVPLRVQSQMELATIHNGDGSQYRDLIPISDTVDTFNILITKNMTGAQMKPTIQYLQDAQVDAMLLNTSISSVNSIGKLKDVVSSAISAAIAREPIAIQEAIAQVIETPGQDATVNVVNSTIADLSELETTINALLDSNIIYHENRGRNTAVGRIPNPNGSVVNRLLNKTIGIDNINVDSTSRTNVVNIFIINIINSPSNQSTRPFQDSDNSVHDTQGFDSSPPPLPLESYQPPLPPQSAYGPPPDPQPGYGPPPPVPQQSNPPPPQPQVSYGPPPPLPQENFEPPALITPLGASFLGSLSSTSLPLPPSRPPRPNVQQPLNPFTISSPSPPFQNNGFTGQGIQQAGFTVTQNPANPNGLNLNQNTILNLLPDFIKASTVPPIVPLYNSSFHKTLGKQPSVLGLLPNQVFDITNPNIIHRNSSFPGGIFLKQPIGNISQYFSRRPSADVMAATHNMDPSISMQGSGLYQHSVYSDPNIRQPDPVVSNPHPFYKRGFNSDILSTDSGNEGNNTSNTSNKTSITHSVPRFAVATPVQHQSPSKPFNVISHSSDEVQENDTNINLFNLAEDNSNIILPLENMEHNRNDELESVTEDDLTRVNTEKSIASKGGVDMDSLMKALAIGVVPSTVAIASATWPYWGPMLLGKKRRRRQVNYQEFQARASLSDDWLSRLTGKVYTGAQTNKGQSRLQQMINSPKAHKSSKRTTKAPKISQEEAEPINIKPLSKLEQAQQLNTKEDNFRTTQKSPTTKRSTNFPVGVTTSSNDVMGSSIAKVVESLTTGSNNPQDVFSTQLTVLNEAGTSEGEESSHEVTLVENFLYNAMNSFSNNNGPLPSVGTNFGNNQNNDKNIIDLYVTSDPSSEMVTGITNSPVVHINRAPVRSSESDLTSRPTYTFSRPPLRNRNKIKNKNNNSSKTDNETNQTPHSRPPIQIQIKTTTTTSKPTLAPFIRRTTENSNLNNSKRPTRKTTTLKPTTIPSLTTSTKVFFSTKKLTTTTPKPTSPSIIQRTTKRTTIASLPSLTTTKAPKTTTALSKTTHNTATTATTKPTTQSTKTTTTASTTSTTAKTTSPTTTSKPPVRVNIPTTKSTTTTEATTTTTTPTTTTEPTTTTTTPTTTFKPPVRVKRPTTTTTTTTEATTTTTPPTTPFKPPVRVNIPTTTTTTTTEATTTTTPTTTPFKPPVRFNIPTTTTTTTTVDTTTTTTEAPGFLQSISHTLQVNSARITNAVGFVSSVALYGAAALMPLWLPIALGKRRRRDTGDYDLTDDIDILKKLDSFPLVQEGKKNIDFNTEVLSSIYDKKNKNNSKVNKKQTNVAKNHSKKQKRKRKIILSDKKSQR